MEADYAEKLKWLRDRFAENGPALVGGRASSAVETGRPRHKKLVDMAMSDVHLARWRFGVACLALHVPDEKVFAALPGFEPVRPIFVIGYRPRPFLPGLLTLGKVDPKEWIEAQLEQCRVHLEGEVKLARERYQLKPPARHRTREFDLAERYLVTVRQRMLSHTYKDIAMDHTQPLPEGEDEIKLAASRLRGIVRDVCEEVSFGKTPTYPAVG